MTNPLLAQKQNSTTWHTGINVLDDAAGVYDGVSSGNWIEGGIAAFGTGMDLLTIAMNPAGTLISYGLNWLIEHVQPLQDALNQLAGDADQIAAYAKTWNNIGQAVGQAAKDLTDAVNKDTANWTGTAADAYRKNVTDKINSLNAAATCANTIGTVVQIVGVITGAVRGLVRDMVTQAIGDFIQDALEEVFSLGLGTPVVVAQVVEQVSAWIEKITGVVKKLINSVEALRPMMSKLEEIWGAIQKVMNALHGHPEGDPHLTTGDGSTHVSSADDPHPTGTGDGTTTTSGTTSTHGDGSTTTSSTHNGSPSTGDGSTTTSSTSSTPSDGSTTGTGDTSTHSTGDGGSIASNNENPRENSQPTETVPQSKDPIDFTTGRVLLDQLDLELPGTLPLVINRCHRSTLRVGRWFGRTWSSTIDQRIEVTGDAVHFAAADGMLLKYPLPGNDASALPVEGVPWPLNRTRDGGYTITDTRSGQTMHFARADGSRRPITAITDRNGNHIDFVYDQNGLITEIRHSGGYRVAVDTADGLISELRLRNPHGADVVVKRYRYNPQRQLTEVISPSGRPTLFEYDTAGRLTRWEDSNGMWYRYSYDSEGRCVRAEGRDGYLNAVVEYDRENLATKHTNSLGHTTTYHLNERLQVIREIDPIGNEKRFEWDRHHRLLAKTDALDRTTRYTYNELGKLALITRADGSQASAEYNELGRPVTVTEPDGAMWRQEYDERGNLVVVTDPTGASTTYDYNEQGHLVAVRDALNNRVLLVNNAAGLPVTFTDATGARCHYHRDFFGRVEEIVDPMGGSTRFTWTVGGKPLSRTAPDGTVDRWNYDGEANVVDHVDAMGQRTHTEIAHFDLPSSQTGPDGARLEFSYNTELSLTAVTNPQGLVWRYEYDAAENLVRETDFNGRVLMYRHDAAGQLVERVNGSGQSTRFTHDLLGNLVERRSTDATAIFEYDPAGRLSRAVNADAELVFERDQLGRVLAEICNGRTVRNGYDPLGRRVSRRMPSGAESGWSYDVRDLPTALHAAGHVVRFDYDAAGREIERALSAGAVLTQTWDANHRLRTQAIASQVATRNGNRPLVQRRSYNYRSDGHLTAIVDQLAGPRQFDLDRAGRVTAVSGNGWTEQYAYDAAGNMTHAGWPASPGLPGADAVGTREYAGTLIRKAGNVRYEHDAQGRITLRQKKRLSAKPLTWRYTWNTEDRLVAVVTPDGQFWRYHYDALGRRIAKQRLAADGESALETVSFAWDGSVLAEQTRHDGRVTVWDWEPGRFRPVSQRERIPLRDAPQETIDEQFYAIVTDLVGTPTEMIDPAGNLAWHIQTNLWGTPLRAPTGSAYTPLRFPGQYYDAETELNYNFHRYYDSETGRYTSNDPLGLNPSPNPQTYVPNPTGLIDPVGLAPYKIYRGMKDDNGAPKVEPTARGLGAREGTDITPDENGMVHPPDNPKNAKGMSTAPEDPQNLQPHRRPPELGGTGKDPVWSLDPDKLPDGLIGVRDKPGHVTIAPARTMPFEEYQNLIASTKGLWEKVEP